MEFDENNELTEQENEAVEIYSKYAILGFSIFFSVIFGGVLLMINLRQAGYKRAGYIVLAFSIVFMLVSMVALSFIGVNANSFSPIIINALGGLILTEYFFKKYFPDNDYYPKSIVKPLIITFLIVIPLAVLVVYLQKVYGLK